MVLGLSPMMGRSRSFRQNRAAGDLRECYWESDAYLEEVRHYPCDELNVVLKGSVLVMDAPRHADAFGKGDVFFTSEGAQVVWDQRERMKKLCMVYATSPVEE